MNAISSITTPVSYAAASISPMVEQTLISSTLQLIIDKIRSFASGIFDTIAKVGQYLAIAIPGIMSIITSIGVVKNIIALHKAIHLGIAKDAWRITLDLLRDIFNLFSYITSALDSLAILLKFLSKGAIRVVAVISCVLGIIVDAIHLIRQAVHLYATYKVAGEMDVVLNRKDLTAQDKVLLIITQLESHLEEREAANSTKLSTAHVSYKEAVDTFLKEQTKFEMETLLGEAAYAKIKEAIEALRDNQDPDDLFVKTVDAIRDAREMIGSKIRQHWVEIAMDIISIAAQALCIAFPALLIPMICVYTLWTIYGVILIANKGINYVENKGHIKDNSFIKRDPESQKLYSGQVLEKTYKTLRSRILGPRLDTYSRSDQKMQKISEILLDSKQFEIYKECAEGELIANTAKKMKAWLHATLVETKEIAELKMYSIEALRKTWAHYEGAFKLNETLARKWKELQERLNIIEEGASRFYSEALKREWTVAVHAA